jgi:hypothetical protein
MNHNNNINENKHKDLKEEKVKEIGGPKGLEPTRYGVDTPEWEVKGRVSDF